MAGVKAELAAKPAAAGAMLVDDCEWCEAFDMVGSKEMPAAPA